MLIALAVVAAVLVLGVAGQVGAEAVDRRKHPAPGRLVRAGDAVLHAVVQGSGPLVVLDSGLGGSSIEWEAVASELSGDATVLRYDRPGFAWSPGSDCDRSALAAARRLLALLDELGLTSPAVLVGHSLGGVHVRVVATLAPERVAGLVLVDPSHEWMLDVVEGSREAAVSRGVLRLLARMAPFGVARLAGRGLSRLTLAEVRRPLTPGQQGGARASGLLTSRTRHGLRALSAEHDALATSLRQLAGLQEPAVPAVVITAGAPATQARAIKAREDIDGMHRALVAARPGARQVVAEESGHIVPLDAPELIVESVRQLMRRTRSTAMGPA